MLTDHWNKATLNFLKPYLSKGESSLKVATGFFTIQGYNHIRTDISELWVRFMVGFDEDAKEKLRQLLIDNIMLHLSRWDAANRRAAVIDLVERIQRGRFQIVEHQEKKPLEARIRKRDHAKIYIIDDRWVLCGSANLTESGLRYNIENLALVEEPGRVSNYIRQFQEYWEAQDTVDLTQALLDALLAWLALSPPFDVYLKTIQVLISEEEVAPVRDTYKMPVNYQMVVIQRLIRQIKAYRGAMLVASTGLGKTIMATHTALCLCREGQIKNVIVFSPLQVQPDWRNALRSAGLSYEIFTRDLLDRPGGRGRKMQEMEEALRLVDDGYLIIIDESQHFRNRYRASDGKKKHSFNRLVGVCKTTAAKVLLLTATPYSKEVGDLNNQLRLLPHTAEKKFIQPDGQLVIPGTKDDEIDPEAWKVMLQNDFFEKFIRLPVATVISTSQVAKDFAEHTEEGDYLIFGEEKKWVPQVEITKVKVPVFLEKEISEAMEQKIFHHKLRVFRSRKQKWQRTKVIIQNKAETSWMSSPRAMEKVIADTLSGKDHVEFIRSREKREAVLKPILDRIRSFDYSDDPKFEALVFYIKAFYNQGRKILVFTERHWTALYLDSALKERLPFLRAACTVKGVGEETHLKDFEKEVMPLIKGFAPEANADKIAASEKLQHYDVFITTDAYSTGVNLQDASVVINYDLAWTPDIIIQRAGRILRFWKNPRRVHFLVFVGNFQVNKGEAKKAHNVENRLRKLSRRGKDAQRFSELPIIPEKDQESFLSLGQLSEVTIEDIGLVNVSQLEEFSGVSPFLRHIAVLKANEAYASQIPNDIASAMYYEGDQPLLYLLLAKAGEYFHIVYNVNKKSIRPYKEDDLLDLIQCTAQTPVAHIGEDEVERIAQECRKTWEQQRYFDRYDDVERVCACYLIPRALETGFREVMEG